MKEIKDEGKEVQEIQVKLSSYFGNLADLYSQLEEQQEAIDNAKDNVKKLKKEIDKNIKEGIKAAGY